MSTACGPRCQIKLSVDWKLLTWLPKEKSAAAVLASTRPSTSLSVCFLLLVSISAADPQRGTKVTRREWNNLFFKKSTFGHALNCPGEPKPSAPFWARSLCHFLSVGWMLVSEVGLLLIFLGGWESRCNVRVLFVSSLFLLFLSFCTIIPFFILYVCFLFSLFMTFVVYCKNDDDDDDDVPIDLSPAWWEVGA